MNNELNEINKKDYKTLTPFKGWVIENFPFIEADFDAITNYQLICKVTEYLNTVIYNQNQVQDLSDDLVDGYNNLLNYVNNYFDNLDVQEEINTKLDKMASDGTLTNLIKNYVDPIYQNYENSINATVNGMNIRLNNFDTRLTSVASGSPLVASSTAGMTDTTRVYVNTTDGKWYYYDGDSWEIGGTYQSTGIGENSIFAQDFESNIRERIGEEVDFQKITNYTNTIGALLKTNGTELATTQYSYYKIDVKEGDKINLNFTINLSSTEYCYIFLNDTTVVSYHDRMNAQASADYTKTITIPTGVNKLVINYLNAYNCYAKFVNVVSTVKLNNDIRDALNIVAPYKAIEPLVLGTDHYIHLNKATKALIVNDSTATYYKKYDVTNLTNIIFTYKNNSSFSEYAYIFTDSVETVLSMGDYPTHIENNAIITEEIYKPANAKYLYIQTSKNYELDIYNRDYSNESSINEYTDFAIKNLERRCTNLEKQNPFEWSTFDKTYFCFVIDDNNSYFPKAVEIFHNAGVPLSSATLISKLSNVYTTYTPSNTKTVKELLVDMVNDGGEVLAHYSGNLAPAGTPDTQSTHYLTTDEDWLQRTRDVKMKLEEEGFDVRGIITADSTKPQTSTGQKYCSLYFDYSDTLGTSKNFHLGRRKFFLDPSMQTMEQAKAYIDNCCQTPGFYPFCFHGTRNDEPLINETDLSELLSYINNKGSNVCVCTTYSNVIDEFGSTELEQRIANLEQ